MKDLGMWGITILMGGCIGAWFTHIIVCIAEGLWGLLIAGAIVFPVGIIHGVGAWFGAW